MDILLDNPGAEKIFQGLLKRITLLKNGETAAQMRTMGVKYRINWGVSVIALRDLARQYEKDHLLALKLWNKQWRETMILATLLEEPDQLNEEQMDYWTKSFETAEMAEQAVSNLFVYSKFAFAKALEYCCGKKHWVRYTGILLMGRLAMVSRDDIDEMFETFFEVIPPLMKDPSLQNALYRSLLLLGNRNENLREQAVAFLNAVCARQEEQSGNLAKILLEDLSESGKE